MDSQRNLERTWKVREFENKWLWQSSKNIYSVHLGKDLLSHESLSPSPSSLGATLKGKNLLLWEANSFP